MYSHPLYFGCDTMYLMLNAQPTFTACRNRSFFSKASTDKAGTSPPSPGGQFLYEEDWGEKYEGVSLWHSIAKLKIRNGTTWCKRNYNTIRHGIG